MTVNVALNSYISKVMTLNTDCDMNIICFTCWLRNQVVLRTVPVAKYIRKNPNSLRSDKRIFAHKATLTVLRTTKIPAEAGKTDNIHITIRAQ